MFSRMSVVVFISVIVAFVRVVGCVGVVHCNPFRGRFTAGSGWCWWSFCGWRGVVLGGLLVVMVFMGDVVAAARVMVMVLIVGCHCCGHHLVCRLLIFF